MRRIGIVLAALALDALLRAMPAGAQQGPAAKPRTRAERVYEVKEVAVRRLGRSGRVAIEAAGTTRTGGWTRPALTGTSRGAEGPADRIAGFDLVAVRPSGLVPQLVAPIVARRRVRLPRRADSVRVCAEQGCVTRVIPR